MATRKRRSNVLVTENITENKAPVSAEDFETSISLYLRDCKIRNLSEHTIVYYKNELNGLMRMLESQKLDTHPSKITKKIVKENIILYMMETLGRKETTINTKLRAARAFFNFLEKESMISDNPFNEISLIQEKKTIIETFNREQLHALLRQPNQSTFTGYRDYTVLMLLLETGVRARELVNIRTKDVNWEDGVIKIDGKGYKERHVPIQATTKRQLRKYIGVRGDVDTEFLFVNIDNEPLSKRRLQEIIAKYGRMAGIKGVRCSPHTFRHTFAKMSVQNGADVFALQAVLGHTSLEMVRNYVNLFSSDVYEKHKRFSPIEKLL